MGGLLACADLILRDKPRSSPEDYAGLIENVARYVAVENADNEHDAS